MITVADKHPFKLFDPWFFLCLLLSFSILLIFVQISSKPTPVIATVDLASIIDTFVADLMALDLDETEQQQRVQNFSQQLERGVADLVKQHKVILLPQEAMLGGADDLTTTLKGLLDASI